MRNHYQLITLAASIPASALTIFEGGDLATAANGFVAGGGGVWQVSLTGGAAPNYVFQSPTLLDFSTGSTNNSVVSNDGRGQATVRMTLTGNPADFVRADTAS